MARRRSGYGGGRWDEPMAPKPYGFVPLAPEVQRAPTVGHEVLLEDHVSGRLEYRLAAQTHLFVSSGTYALSEDLGRGVPGGVVRTCYRVITVEPAGRARLVPAIPGSSLKGAVRAVFEAVTPSCVGVTRVDRDLLRRTRDEGGRCTPARACPACSVFGTMSRLGKVRFADALLQSGPLRFYRLPNLYRPRLDRRQIPQVYLDRGKLKGRKFFLHGRMAQAPDGAPAEVIAAGGVLAASLDFINLTRQELGALLFALGADQSFALKLGGAKPACLGTVATELLALAFQTADSLTSYEPETERLEGEKVGGYARALIAEGERAGGYLLQPQVQHLRQVLRPDQDRDCPTGPY